jgi:hypothetical protein
MAISTNGTVLTRLAGALYNTQMSNATYSEVKALDPATLADALYARDFSASTDAAVATTLVTNLGLASVAGLDNWVAAQLTAAGAHKGAKIVDLLNSFAQMTADTTYGAYATAFNTKVDAALAASQTTGNAGGTFAAAGVAPAPVNGTFALTTSIDAIVGGAGDDAITAAATSASTGTANTTVNSGDSVDGGAGTDTLTITATSANNNSLSGLTVTGVEKIVIAGSDNLAVTAAGAATVAAGAAQIIDWAVQAGAALTAASHTITAVVNGVTHTTTYTGHATTGVADKQAAIVTLLNKVLGGTATAAGTSPEITLTSKAKGVALPTITITEVAFGATTSTDAVAADTATGFKTIANAAVTGAAAVAEVVTIAVDDGTTANFAGTETLGLYINGVNYGTAAIASTATEAAVATQIAGLINTVLGTGVAVAVGGTVTVTAPVAGTPLPHFNVALTAAAGEGSLTYAVARENAAVGAATTTTSTAATVAASQFTGATSIAVDGAATTVSALTTQSVTLSGTSMANTLKYSAAATSANIVLSAASGTVTLDDNSSTTATTGLIAGNVTGTVKATAASGNTQSTPGQITIDEALGTSNADTIKTLSLGLTSGATVVTTGMSKLATFDASTSTGAVTATLAQTGLNNVKGGSGNDVLAVTFATDLNGTTNTSAATFAGGAGNDTLTISAVGTGTLAVNGDAGNDTIVVGTTLLNTRLTINGGEGTDKLKFTAGSTTLTAGEFALIASQVTGVERAEFATATSLDASKVTQFSVIDLGADTATVTKLADAQSVNAAITSALTANGYIAKGSAEATAAGLTDTAYAGSLVVNASGASKTVTINANSATVNLNNIVSTASGSAGDQSASSVTLAGDVKTLNVNMTGGNNYVQSPTSNDVLSTLTVTPAATLTGGAGTGFAANGNLTSITLSGAGTAVIDNSANSGGVATSKLVTIDATNFGAVKGALAGTAAGNPLAGLTYTGNTYLAETVSLGKGLDTLTLNSTYDKMDTITGFTLVGNSDLSLNTDKSDAIVSTATVVKMTTGLTGGTLGAVLTQVAASAASGNDNVVFQWNGDTYYFKESSSTSTTLDAADTVVKFTGLVDLDLLILALA